MPTTDQDLELKESKQRSSNRSRERTTSDLLLLEVMVTMETRQERGKKEDPLPQVQLQGELIPGEGLLLRVGDETSRLALTVSFSSRRPEPTKPALPIPPACLPLLAHSLLRLRRRWIRPLAKRESVRFPFLFFDASRR